MLSNPQEKLKLVRNISINIILLLLILFILISIANSVYGWYTIENAQVFAGGLGALGTVVLAWFTFKTIQQNEELVEHQQQQIKQQQARSRPVLRQISDISIISDDEVKLELENVGEGTAYNIHFKMDIVIPEINLHTTQSNRRNDHSKFPSLYSIERAIYAAVLS